MKAGTFAIPPLTGEALEVYRATCERQTEAYRRLGDLLVPVAARAFYGTFRGRESQPSRWEKAIRKRALEVARYVLPVATFTTLYHTVSAVTLFRYRRLAATFDAPTEQRLVVEAMTQELLRHDPAYAGVLEEPVPLEATPEFALAERLFGGPRPDRPGDASFRARFDAGLGGRISRLVDRKARNEELLAEAVREVVGISPEALSDDEAIARAARAVVDPARPTRAEASEAANAVLDGADALMLSGETSVGKHAFAAVRTMARIIENTEDHGLHRIRPLGTRPSSKGGAVTAAAADIGELLGVKFLITFTESGDSTRRLSRVRPRIPMLAFTPNQWTRSQLALTWGVETFLVGKAKHTDEMAMQVDEVLLAAGRVLEGDTVIIVAGSPPGIPGSTNALRVHRVGDAKNRVAPAYSEL